MSRQLAADEDERDGLAVHVVAHQLLGGAVRLRDNLQVVQPVAHAGVTVGVEAVIPKANLCGVQAVHLDAVYDEAHVDLELRHAILGGDGGRDEAVAQLQLAVGGNLGALLFDRGDLPLGDLRQRGDALGRGALGGAVIGRGTFGGAGLGGAAKSQQGSRSGDFRGCGAHCRVIVIKVVTKTFFNF